MAVVYTCDGCNQVTALEALETRGLMELLYCSKCLPSIDEFLLERDKLHDEVQRKWDLGITRLQRSYHHSLIGKLPDELET